MAFSSYAETRVLDQIFGGTVATVGTTIAAGTAGVVSITVPALAAQIPSGSVLLVSYGTGSVESFTTSAVANAGATSISVTSKTSQYAHTAGDNIVIQGNIVQPATVYVGLALQAGTLTTALVAGTTVTSLAVTATAYAIASGDVVAIGQSGEYAIASAAAAQGATSISINSFTPVAAYATGTVVTDVSAPVEPGTGAYARVAQTANNANFPAATGTSPATMHNANQVQFPAATANWGSFGHFVINDSPTAGNQILWGYLNVAQTINNGQQPSFGASALTFTLK